MDEERSVCKIIRTNNQERARPFQSERFANGATNFEIEEAEYASQNWLAFNCLQLLDKKLPSVNEIMNANRACRKAK